MTNNSSYITSDTGKLAEKLFRHNYAKMVAILARYFGLKNVEIAEDIVQDTLMEAMKRWSVGTTPRNPEAWLMDVAKKKTINFLKREQLFKNKISARIRDVYTYETELEFSEEIINDSTLRMIFSCCHPSIPVESQIALALKTLCGLNIAEISNALLTSETNVNKRLYRAKKRFRNGSVQFKIPNDTELSDRLDSVFSTLYLLFNEGYFSLHDDNVIRMDLCFEAIRLLKQVISSFPESNKAKALLALMLLTVARFESRLDANGTLIILSDQNRKLWDRSLIAEGMNYLHQSLNSTTANKYQLQTGIAAEHCLAESFQSTNWQSVYKQYCILEKMDANPIISFNKCISKYYSGLKREALNDLLKMKNIYEMETNPHYFVTLGVFYSELNEKEKAETSFKAALKLSKSTPEKELIQSKMNTYL